MSAYFLIEITLTVRQEPKENVKINSCKIFDGKPSYMSSDQALGMFIVRSGHVTQIAVTRFLLFALFFKIVAVKVSFRCCVPFV